MHTKKRKPSFVVKTKKQMLINITFLQGEDFVFCALLMTASAAATMTIISLAKKIK